METDIALLPMDIGILGAAGITARAVRFAEAVSGFFPSMQPSCVLEVSALYSDQ
jgi:hypothetical protein